MSEKQKILLCGDVEGRFDTLFNRIKSINNKSGPFDCLLCVGNFFGINNTEFEAYQQRKKTVAIPTYVLGPNSEDHVPLYKNDYELCPNVYYLGKKGVYTTSGGLKIAYMSGSSSLKKSSNDYEYTCDDLIELYNACVRGNPTFRGVDILLTSQWPSNVSSDSNVVKSSDFPAWISMKIKPRYHVSGLEGVYYERAPFRCPNVGDHDTTVDLVTRFLGLARVGNPSKDKWLFALSLTPLDKMKYSELMQKTTDETDCPYDLAKLDEKIFNLKRKNVGSNQYFYDTNAPIDGDGSNRRKRAPKRARVEFDQSKCWFCLASPSVEKHLVITVGTSAYLALAKGGLVEEHLLICPIEHHQNSLDQPDEISQEIDRFKEALRKFYARNGHVAVFFERNYKTSHMQLQVIPIPNKATREVKEIFIEEAEGHGITLDQLDRANCLDQVLQANVPFFMVELPDGTVLYTRIKGNSNFPLNFGREVLAVGPILNKIERVDWRECILPRDREESLVQRIRTDFEPFDFTLD